MSPSLLARTAPLLASPRAALAEALHMARSPLRGRGGPLTNPSPTLGLPPVLLVHGFMGHGGLLQPMARAVLDAGWPQVVVVQYPSVRWPVERVAAHLEQQADALGGTVDVVGHSLGGALAQLAACNMPGSVNRIVTFQSPAVSEEDYQKLADHNAQAAPEDQIDSTHFRAHGDLVHLAGDKLTDGDVVTMDYVGVGNIMDHTSFPLAHLAAARAEGNGGEMLPGIENKGDRILNVERKTAKEEKEGSWIAKQSEKARKGFLGMLVGGEDKHEELSTAQDTVKELAAMGYSEKRIRQTVLLQPWTDKTKNALLANLHAVL